VPSMRLLLFRSAAGELSNTLDWAGVQVDQVEGHWKRRHHLRRGVIGWTFLANRSEAVALAHRDSNCHRSVGWPDDTVYSRRISIQSISLAIYIEISAGSSRIWQKVSRSAPLHLICRMTSIPFHRLA
jgi:hypothetical protein